MRHDKQQTEKYSEFEDSLILNEKQCRCLRRKVREHLLLIQLIVSESCLCFISANTRLLLQHTINYSTFSTRMWGGAREKWMTKSAERGWSVAEVICEPFSCRPHKLNVQSCTRLSPSLSCPLILKHSPCAFLSTPPSSLHPHLFSCTISDQALDSQIVFAPKKPINVTLTKENAKQRCKNSPLFPKTFIFSPF